MTKRIIFCADGTWENVQNDTNVYKLFKALALASQTETSAKPVAAAPSPPKTPDFTNHLSGLSKRRGVAPTLLQKPQIVFYDDGVGANGTLLERLLGGALGDGLFQKIKDGYTKIAHVYEPGDDLFLFGFSRGAYTARSLAGMIAICGLPAANFDDHLVNTAFQAYRQRDPNQRNAILATLENYNLFDAKIKMVGVWDTVGALGIPALFGGVDPLIYGFLDTNLHPDVLNAFQALAIDERRREFPPTLWTVPSPPVVGQTLEQVWFSGVHCDVGGGYTETGLSDVTFSWMLAKATALGLQVNADVLNQYASLPAQYALAQLHNSWDILWGFPESRTIADNSILANSVAIRLANDDSYRPGNLVLNNGSLADSYRMEPVLVGDDVRSLII